MGNNIWLECVTISKKILEMIEKDATLITTDKEKDKQRNIGAALLAPIGIRSSLVLFLDRLEQEYYKSLQDADMSKIAGFVRRMKEISLLIDLAKSLLAFYKRVSDMKATCKVCLVLLKYAHHVVSINSQKDGESKVITATADGMNVSPLEEVEDLAKTCFQYGDERQKTHGMLYYISYLANTDRWFKARDLMLMSHLQDTIQNADVDTQILYNRSTVFLGLCAFRAAKIVDAHNCLSEICSSARVKELLAQGIVRYSDKNAEQSVLEARRQIPTHMHINLDLLETIHLVCALLLEVPNSAACAFDKRKPISRTLRKFLEYANRQIFNGPPESTREYVICAAKALSRGDWKKCCGLLFSIKIWRIMPNHESVIQMIKQKVKEEGLRTYMFIAASNYDSLSLERLSNMFELPNTCVHSILSKMMMNGELHASWDQPSASIVMHKVEPNQLQALGLQFSEKILTFVDSNERLLESKTSLGKYDPLKDRYSDWSTRTRYKPRYNPQQNQQTNQRPRYAPKDRRSYRPHN